MSSPAVEHARALVELGRWADAVTALQPVLADPAADADAWCLLARCELALGRMPEARRAAEQAVAVDPEHEWAHRLVAVVRLRRGDAAGALAACLRALDLVPDQCEGLHLLTTIRLAEPRGRGVEEAERVAQHNLRVNPDRALAWESAADVAAARRRWPDVEAYARRGLAIDPHDADLAMALGHALRNQGRAAEAGAAYAAAARADPTDDRPRRAIGRLGLPLVGGGLLLVKLFAVLGVRGIALWAAAPVWALLVILGILIGLAYAITESMAWRTRRTLPPTLGAVALRERKVAARGWLAATAVVTLILAARALADGRPGSAVAVLALAVALVVVRTRLPLPADHVPGRSARAAQSIRRRFR